MVGAELLLETIRQIEAGTVRREKQRSEDATLAPILKKEDGLVDWHRPAHEIFNRWRGFNPWPGAYTLFRGQQISITGMRLPERTLDPPGRLHVEKHQLYVGCGDGSAIECLEIQLAGKKRMNAEAFLHGYRLASNEMLGEKP